MKQIKFMILFFAIFSYNILAQTTPNILNNDENEKGWIVLFNGIDLEGWTSVGRETSPEKGWTIEEGVLTVNKGGAQKGGDIITKGQFGDFELSFEFRLTKGANSGIKYLFSRYDTSGWLGNEYQVLDDDFHPDAKGGRNGNRKTASLYDILPAENTELKPTGEWNRGRIIIKGSEVNHYLNGKKVVSYDRKSELYKEAVQQSKFNNVTPLFGTIEKGHILLQDHEDEVSYRKIKIKNL